MCEGKLSKARHENMLQFIQFQYEDKFLTMANVHCSHTDIDDFMRFYMDVAKQMAGWGGDAIII